MNSLLRKIVVYIIDTQHFYLVNVCAWCPKEAYPKLRSWQKYTHGICRKHYLALTTHKPKATLWNTVNRMVDQILLKETITGSTY